MNLKQMRELVGLKQTELSAISGVNLRSLQDYEQGHKALSSAKGETLLRISRALGYSIEDLLSENIVVEPELWNEERMASRLMAYENCLRARREKEFHFPIVEADEFVDMSRVYPTKQNAVMRVLRELRLDGRVTSLRLFGSSITMACHKDSDLDFAVRACEDSSMVRNEISEEIQTACDWGADIIWMDHISSKERIYDEIMKGLQLI